MDSRTWILGDTIVGATPDMDTGAVYVFRARGGATYGRQVARARQGRSTVAVGAEPGAVQIFRTTDGGAVAVDKLTASDGAAGRVRVPAFDGGRGRGRGGGAPPGSASGLASRPTAATYDRGASASDAAASDNFAPPWRFASGTVVVGLPTTPAAQPRGGVGGAASDGGPRAPLRRAPRSFGTSVASTPGGSDRRSSPSGARFRAPRADRLRGDGHRGDAAARTTSAAPWRSTGVHRVSAPPAIGGAVYVFHTSSAEPTLTARQVCSVGRRGERPRGLRRPSWLDGNTGTCSGSHWRAYVFRTTDGGVTSRRPAAMTAASAASWHLRPSTETPVGPTGRSRNAISVERGSYVFRTSDGGATYGQVATLTADDAAAYVLLRGDRPAVHRRRLPRPPGTGGVVTSV